MSLVSIQAALEQNADYQQFLAEERAEEARRREKILAPINAERRQIAKTMANLQTPQWSKPVPELKKAIAGAQQNKSVLTSWFWDVLLRGGDPNPVTTDQNEQGRIFDAFVEQTLASQGWRLSVGGCVRLWAFAYVSREIGNYDITADNLQLYFDALQEHGCFDDKTGELSYTEPQHTPAPRKEVTLADLENLDTSTPEGRNAAKTMADELYVNELTPLVIEWRKSVLANFGYTVSLDDLKYMNAWFNANSKSWLDRKNFDLFRVHMVKTGRWSPAEKFLTTDEIRSRLVDRIDLTSSDVRHQVFYGNRETLLGTLQRNNIGLV